MKKVKLMLLSLSIFAIVGAALAFTVKTGDHFCTAATVLDSQGNITCPAACPSEKALTAVGATKYICTTPTSGLSTPCKNASGANLGCQATIFSTIE